MKLLKRWQNEQVSFPSSLWAIMLFYLYIKTYRIFNSNNIDEQFSLMWSTIDARRVDFPLPVVPVTSISPLGAMAMSSII